MGSSLNEPPFWAPFYKGAVLFGGPKLENYPCRASGEDGVRYSFLCCLS